MAQQNFIICSICLRGLNMIVIANVECLVLSATTLVCILILMNFMVLIVDFHGMEITSTMKQKLTSQHAFSKLNIFMPKLCSTSTIQLSNQHWFI